MPIDLNMDMGAVIKEMVSKRRNASSSSSMSAGSKLPITTYKFAIIISVVMLLVAVLYVSFVYIPLKEKNIKKIEELNKVLEMKTQLSVLDGQIENLKKKLEKSKEEYIESLAHFGSSDDLGDLYQVVSTLATKYNLVVLNVKELALPPPPPPAAKTTAAPAPDGASAEKKDDKSASAATTTAATDASAPKKPAVSVKESKVALELKGHYGEYIKFKEDLASAAALLKINSESIMVKNETTEQGSIYVKLELSTYAIDKKPFQGIITDKENEKAK